VLRMISPWGTVPCMMTGVPLPMSRRLERDVRGAPESRRQHLVTPQAPPPTNLDHAHSGCVFHFREILLVYIVYLVIYDLGR